MVVDRVEPGGPVGRCLASGGGHAGGERWAECRSERGGGSSRALLCLVQGGGSMLAELCGSGGAPWQGEEVWSGQAGGRQ